LSSCCDWILESFPDFFVHFRFWTRLYVDTIAFLWNIRRVTSRLSGFHAFFKDVIELKFILITSEEQAKTDF
jgi:hypothetical protein